jgi:hypothetical protein
MPDLQPPWSRIPLVNDETNLLPADVMAAILAALQTAGAQTFVQPTPLASWHFTFPDLGRRPGVTLYDTAGNVVDADVTTTQTSVSVSFPYPFAGAVAIV